MPSKILPYPDESVSNKKVDINGIFNAQSNIIEHSVFKCNNPLKSYLESKKYIEDKNKSVEEKKLQRFYPTELDVETILSSYIRSHEVNSNKSTLWDSNLKTLTKFQVKVISIGVNAVLYQSIMKAARRSYNTIVRQSMVNEDEVDQLVSSKYSNNANNTKSNQNDVKVNSSQHKIVSKERTLDTTNKEMNTYRDCVEKLYLKKQNWKLKNNNSITCMSEDNCLMGQVKFESIVNKKIYPRMRQPQHFLSIGESFPPKSYNYKQQKKNYNFLSRTLAPSPPYANRIDPHIGRSSLDIFAKEPHYFHKIHYNYSPYLQYSYVPRYFMERRFSRSISRSRSRERREYYYNTRKKKYKRKNNTYSSDIIPEKNLTQRKTNVIEYSERYQESGYSCYNGDCKCHHRKCRSRKRSSSMSTNEINSNLNNERKKSQYDKIRKSSLRNRKSSKKYRTNDNRIVHRKSKSTGQDRDRDSKVHINEGKLSKSKNTNVNNHSRNNRILNDYDNMTLSYDVTKKEVIPHKEFISYEKNIISLMKKSSYHSINGIEKKNQN